MPSQKQEKTETQKTTTGKKKAIWALEFLWNNYQIMFTTTTRRKLIIATTNSKNTQVVG